MLKIEKYIFINRHGLQEGGEWNDVVVAREHAFALGLKLVKRTYLPADEEEIADYTHRKPKWIK